MEFTVDLSGERERKQRDDVSEAEKRKEEEDRCEHTEIGRDYSVKIVAIQI